MNSNYLIYKQLDEIYRILYRILTELFILNLELRWLDRIDKSLMFRIQYVNTYYKKII